MEVTRVDLHELVLNAAAHVGTLLVEVGFRLDGPSDLLTGLLARALWFNHLILLVEIRQT